jgi:hypothetical protein
MLSKPVADHMYPRSYVTGITDLDPDQTISFRAGGGVPNPQASGKRAPPVPDPTSGLRCV